ncbi:MAG TPA: UbiA family prenyltransferase [Cytophagaceae bacterium]|jgi:1,4-dihydroxy-2-naphthoate octaprenyltransferase
MQKSVIQHLRIPFSLFLLPFYCFALSQARPIILFNSILSFIIIHFLFYPASNGYNSYFDKDEESIGGLKNPPPVVKQLYNVSLVFDLIALILSFFISWRFALMIFVIGLASKAYSHPAIRLKKYPFLGLLTVAYFQGSFTYMMSYLAITDCAFSDLLNFNIVFPSLLCSAVLFGSYPMTQVYQHGEDGRRGDKTISLLLGIKGTFLWTAVIFILALGGFYYFLNRMYSIAIFGALVICLLPTLFYFFFWFYKVLVDRSNANFESTMRLNMLSSIGFITFFISLLLIANL